MQLCTVSLALLLVLVGVFGEPEPQFGGYPYPYQTPYVTNVRGYPARPYAAPAEAYYPIGPYSDPRLFWQLLTTTSISTTFSLLTCTYSTAAIATCARKRRGITIDEDEDEDEETISASKVHSVVPSAAAEIEDVREKRHFGYASPSVLPSYYFDPSEMNAYPVPMFANGGGRIFNNFLTRTETSVSTTTIKVSQLVTCVPKTGSPYGRC